MRQAFSQSRTWFRSSTPRALLIIFLLFALLSGVVIYLSTEYLKSSAVSTIAREDAHQTSQLIFDSLYSVMRRGWTRQEMQEVIDRLDNSLPDSQIILVRSEKVAQLYGETDSSEEQRNNSVYQHVLRTGEEYAHQEAGALRYVFPVVVMEECLGCHANTTPGDVNGVIDIQIPLERLQKPIEQSLNTSFYVFGGTILFLFLAIFWNIQRFLIAPIRSLSRHVDEIRESHDLTRRLPPESKWFQEVRQLSENFNDMIRRLEMANQLLVQESEEDPLTGVFNRRKFDNVAEFELEVARRNNLDVSFLMFDLNKFKPINDELGHAAGDVVLVEVARLLRESVRDSDVCGRFGGDEFVIMAPETDGAQALHLASVLKSAIQGLKIEYDSRVLSIGASVGVSTFPYDADHYDDLINIADNRMYKDKHTGQQGELVK